MADLTPDDGDRGQLLLVAGFAIAVTIVALVLLLNTAIYTENLATRDVDTDSGEALAFRDTVEDNLWTVVERTALNDDDETSRADVEANVTRRIERFENYTTRHVLAGGADTDVETVAFHDGVRVRQTDSGRDLTDGSDTANWIIASDVEDVRRFELNTTGGLRSTTDPGGESFRLDIVGNGGSGDRWSLYVYKDTTDGPTVAVKNGSETTPTDVCEDLVSGPPRVGVRAGTVNDAGCDGIDFAAGTTPPYDVAITRGDRSRGTYDAVLNTTTVDGSLDDTAPLASPYWVPVVYGFDANLTYQSSTLTYRSRVGISPTPRSADDALRFAKASGEAVRTSNGDVLEFRIENTAGENVTVEAFAVDATGIGAGITIDDSGPELDIQRTDVRIGEADRAGEFDADGTSYDFVADSDGSGQYAIIGAGVDDAEVDLRRFSQDLGTMEITYDRSEADLTITFVLGDGSKEVFYLHER
jgi:hypothetical protein